eukprot:186541-Rhodomonas_salina.2
MTPAPGNQTRAEYNRLTDSKKWLQRIVPELADFEVGSAGEQRAVMERRMCWRSGVQKSWPRGT